MANPEDPFAAIANIGPNNEYPNYEIHHHVTNVSSRTILDAEGVTLSVKCPSCEKSFYVCTNLTAGTATTTTEIEFNAAGTNFPVHENRKHESNKKNRNKGRLKAAAAADRNNYTPPISAGKRGRTYDFDPDSEDDPRVPRKSNDVNRYLKFNN
ncbi:unnamed protein product [Fraxinus pennsylvanica]|uniref:Uncharacterized protein n=1 Tax=Fraxinus pennsylvanica TaxID=56036 RepID=A0AAD2E250_9LAMI|nr:unnamed protein product [Fraxinus pennsylvanica]